MSAREESRTASTLELFLDLAFVFAIAQITSYLSQNLTVAGALKALLLAWFAWWQWTAFTWAGTSTDLKARHTVRVMILTMVPIVLTVAVTLPRALTDQGPWFAIGYCLVQVWVLAIQWTVSSGDDASRLGIRRYAPLALLAPSVVLVGGFLPEGPRLWVWVLAALMFVGSAIFGARGDEAEWSISPDHFAERHSLFIILALGEILIAVGAKVAAADELTGVGLLALIATVAVACGLWWLYFAYIPDVFKHVLDMGTNRERGRIARDAGSFIHFPLVCGYVSYAVVAKHVVDHPLDRLEVADQVLLAAVGVLAIGALMAFQWRLARAVSVVRAGGLGCILALSAISGLLPGLVTIAALAVILIAVSAMSAKQFERSPIGQAIRH